MRTYTKLVQTYMIKINLPCPCFTSSLSDFWHFAGKWCIVEWVSGFTDALRDINRFAEFYKCLGCIWATLVTVKNQPAFLSAWNWRSKQKKGARKAIVALARKLLIYTSLLKQAPLFDESCFEAKHKSCEKNRFLGTYGN